MFLLAHCACIDDHIEIWQVDQFTVGPYVKHRNRTYVCW